ncbi:winged helix-turn-helix domain-containing protein [Streptomyces sp. NPDC057909]|uniref:winged helix-turn-helix domain-containing protein n=1 Tax=Streptomyces sp. NPDC057909 TaxID=3346277 RepID=UPI0036E20EDB
MTPQAVSLWRRAWAEGGRAALLSKGPGGSSYLSAEQERERESLLCAGPTAYGREDQRWTLARVGVLIVERFEVRYEISGVRRLLDRLGWSWQVPKVRAVERNEAAVPWRTKFPSAQVTAGGGWVCFEDEAGAWLNGPVRRTWGKAGQTPVLRLSGKRNDKISMVAWACFKDGEKPWMIYAVKRRGGCSLPCVRDGLVGCWSGLG